jgi:two-component system NtrC family sensor kinase
MKSTGPEPITTLSELGQYLSKANRPEAIVSYATNALHELLKPDRLLFVLIPVDGEPRTVAYAHNCLSPRPDDPLIELALQSGALLIPSEVEAGAAQHGVALEMPTGSWMGAPISTAESTIGCVSLSSDTPGQYTDRDLVVFQAVLVLCAIALADTRRRGWLAKGKNDWERTVDATRQAFCVLDESGIIHRANRAFADLVDLPVTEVANRPWISVVPPDWADPLARALATDRSVQLKRGSNVFRIVALPVSDGDRAMSVLVLEDETEMHELRDQLIQSQKMAAIGELVAGVAHDINNPLASVAGFAEYLVDAKTAELPPSMIEPLTAIQEQAQRAANIARNLLAFTRKGEAHVRTVQIGPILESTLQMLRYQLMAWHLESELNIAEGLPPVEADHNQLQQVFVNLVHNAAQAMHTSGVGTRIAVSALPVDDGISVTVRDDGPGVPADMADRIFEPFFSTRSEGEGTGLGLSICQRIIKEHKGSICLVRDSGQGAVFRVELPSGSGPDQQGADAVTQTEALNVLVVDDEQPFLDYLQAVLRVWGNTVTVARDGREALSKISHQTFDAIISDLWMSPVDGRMLFETLKRDHPEAADRLVFCTGDTVSGQTLAFLQSLDRPYLQKPFTLTELRSILHRMAGLAKK